MPADRQAIVVCTGSKHEYSTKSKPYVPAPCLLAVAAGCCYDGCCFGSRPVSYPSPRSGPPNFGGGERLPSQFPASFLTHTHAAAHARTHNQPPIVKRHPANSPPTNFPLFSLIQISHQNRLSYKPRPHSTSPHSRTPVSTSHCMDLRRNYQVTFLHHLHFKRVPSICIVWSSGLSCASSRLLF